MENKVVMGPWIKELRYTEPGIEPVTIIVLVLAAVLFVAFIAWHEWRQDQRR
tara:strand:+ start:764 stop:919 length:156 start_codon:yes stop_codon:yes gene_type:complete